MIATAVISSSSLSLLTCADNFVVLYRGDNDYNYDYNAVEWLRILIQESEGRAMIRLDFEVKRHD